MLSSANKRLTIIVMNTDLATLVKAQRERTGLSLRKTAETLGMASGHFSQIETGKITLPNAHVRRTLAAWLGISHLDLLVAAGEIGEDEIAAAGAVGVKPDYAPGSARIHALVNQIAWTEHMADWVTRMLTEMIDLQGQRGNATPSSSAVEQVDESSR